MALSGTGKSRLPTLEELRTLPLEVTFPAARSPYGARAGLLLHYGRWDEAHNVAQELETPEGSFWHAIVHRLEPDPGNAEYWFRRTGRHPVFPALRAAVRDIEARIPQCSLEMGNDWDPFRWIEFWESARRDQGSDALRMAKEIATIEWQLLFDFCVETP
jgi:hypothetical protein